MIYEGTLPDFHLKTKKGKTMKDLFHLTIALIDVDTENPFLTLCFLIFLF